QAYTLSGFPKPKVQWFHNGKVITSSTVYKFVEERDEYTLIITQVKKEYEGEYSCTASNRFGQTTSEKWVEQMFKLPGQPPCFTTQIQPVRCAEGSEVKFQYRVTGTPFPDVQWFKSKSQIKSSQTCSVVSNPDGTGFLIMNNIQQSDSGLYTCKAVNPFGEASCSAELIYPMSSHQVETKLPIVKEHSQVIPHTQQEKGYQVKEGVKILYSAVSTEKQQITEGHSKELST
uniref:Ig-like domain-containing protein n=1 Tax=Cyprinus carpio TaxID=7962 RepID=A0A8C2FME7_CYPCA